jgi:hypothetical protein
MSKVTIITEGLKDLKSIKSKLEDRDSQVTLIQNISDIEKTETNTLICSDHVRKTIGDESQLLSLARKFKINKVILVDGYSSNFKLTKELGGALIKINLVESDVYSEEALLAFCSEDQKFITGSNESLILKNLAKKSCYYRCHCIYKRSYRNW